MLAIALRLRRYSDTPIRRYALSFYTLLAVFFKNGFDLIVVEFALFQERFDENVHHRPLAAQKGLHFLGGLMKDRLDLGVQMVLHAFGDPAFPVLQAAHE